MDPRCSRTGLVQVPLLYPSLETSPVVALHNIRGNGLCNQSECPSLRLLASSEVLVRTDRYGDEDDVDDVEEREDERVEKVDDEVTMAEKLITRQKLAEGFFEVEEIRKKRIHKAWRTTAFVVYGYLNFTKSGFMEHSKYFKVEDMRPRMDGKNCIFTGANSGIGFAAAEGLASRGASVYMVCRSKERGEPAVSKIQSNTRNQNVYLEVCDLSSVNEIKTFAEKLNSKEIPVHVLVNNNGILENKRTLTPEGQNLCHINLFFVCFFSLELSFAVNVLGTYVMTQSMQPLLEKAAPDSRVITVASGGMYTAPLTKDLQFSEEKFDGTMQYARNKRVLVALTEKWAEMYKDKGIGFYAMHPGWAETLGVAKNLPEFFESSCLNLQNHIRHQKLKIEDVRDIWARYALKFKHA
ncbi:hypothetical protein RND81_07G036800 [Saponaria officinalis]|uniref:Dehydrogenase/reductase SDR family member 12 n=1 Tax=Saponaria officinalis TaxID=3572 RepID=A0AAW1JM19_SAPOF